MIKGGCHCGNISYVAGITNELSSYTPRACDCKLCRSHGAAYASDNNGSLSLKIIDTNEVNKYRQGSRIVDFIICRQCGVLTNVCYEEDGSVFGSINIRASNEYEKFGDAQVVNLTQLDDAEKIKRWKKFWFTNVTVKDESA